ncbi:hypothetical protein SCA6_006377 [Theobroma cacao]|uniref:TF-B3 domain-containing protein n=1 Tax=Theobroma cacao TaxID=3641 RepID=A0A061DZJ0_THECC|nr:Uncharacterized protein TCM_006965 [Theobroma cacao]
MKLFSKLLSQTDIRKRLSIPMKSFQSFPRFKAAHALDLQVKDESGVLWQFRLCIRKKNYLKPVFSTGWGKFVQSKNLQVGDKVKLYKEADQASGAQFKIKAKKAVKIFGVVFGYAKA